MCVKLLIVTPSLNLGGAERSLARLVRVIQPLTSRLDIVCIAGGDETIIQELPNGVHLTCLNSRSANPFAWLKIRQMLKRQQPDMVLGWSTYAGFVAMVASQLGSICKVVLSERNYIPQIYGKASRASLRFRLVLLLMRKLYRHANIITANSHNNVRFLHKYVGAGPAYRLLPNVIDVQEATSLSENEVNPALKHIKGLRILALGRLDRQKGFDILIRAFACVRENHSWQLVIVGAGEEKKALIDLADSLGVADAIEWVGPAPNPFPYYRWAQMVVVPSRYEGFPNVPLEAMSIGRAVICSDCRTGPRELTVNGRFGRLVPVEDVQALADAITEIGLSTDLMNELGIAARQHVLEHYDVNAVGPVYAKVLELAND